MLRFAKDLRSLFPQDDYTPYGYLHTPDHTGTHPSGLVRSVPPLGFGLYCRGFTWYGMDALRSVNGYVSALMPSLRVGGTLLADGEDFERNGVALVSRCHSSNVMSYDFCFGGVDASLAWYTDAEDALFCRAVLKNTADRPVRVRLDAAHAYGMTGRHWWGSDAVTARYVRGRRAMVSKILAYGDVFALGSDAQASGAAVARSPEELRRHRLGEEKLSEGPASVPVPGPLYSALEWDMDIAPGAEARVTLALVRSVNEEDACRGLEKALSGADALLLQRVEEDNRFCERMPVLGKGWPDAWRRGMVYHYQTLRMNVLAPRGRFTGRWDGMQTANPRMVLGESSIDMLCLHYADPETALEVLTTVFEDSPGVHVPCCREDGSVNMIGLDGSECATALMWGFPWLTLRTLLASTGNVAWLRRLYPRLRECADWWRDNRTDGEGWYHCNNSWESGQDGSRRFVSDEESACAEGMNSDHVRAVDLEATMAQTAGIMEEFAKILGEEEDAERYGAMYRRGAERVRAMFFGDRFRDVDARTGLPFTSDVHDDPMLTMPLAVRIATDEQIEKTKWILDALVDLVDKRDYRPNGAGVFWPPILQTLTESLSGAGRAEDAAHVTAVLADTAWRRDDSRKTWELKSIDGIPDSFHRRIPGNARENLSDDIAASGTENYGWGCVAIALFARHILGLRSVDPLGEEWEMRPVLPDILEGDLFEVKNFPLPCGRSDIELERVGEGLAVRIRAEREVRAEGAQGLHTDGEGRACFTLSKGSGCVLRRS